MRRRLYKCKLCNKTFKNPKELEKHLEEYHKVKNTHWAYTVTYGQDKLNQEELIRKLSNNLIGELSPMVISLKQNERYRFSLIYTLTLTYDKPLTLHQLYSVLKTINDTFGSGELESIRKGRKRIEYVFEVNLH